MNIQSIVISACILFLSNIALAQTTSTPSAGQDIKNSLLYIKELKPKVYEDNQYGFNKVEAEKAVPGLVKESQTQVAFGKNQFKTKRVKALQMESLIPILVASIKDQQEEIENLRKEIELLKKSNQRTAN